MFASQPINGRTINSVPMPPSFCALLYALALSILILGFAHFLAKKCRPWAAFRMAVVAAFFGSGLVYAVHADIGWASWLVSDFSRLAGRDVDSKLTQMDGYGQMYSVARSARGVLEREYMLLAGDGYVRLRTEYLLLPKRRRDTADDILVLDDASACYDPATRTLTRGNLKITDVEPVIVYARGAYILRKRKS